MKNNQLASLVFGVGGIMFGNYIERHYNDKRLLSTTLHTIGISSSIYFVFESISNIGSINNIFYK